MHYNYSFKNSGWQTACINRAVPALCQLIYSTVRDFQKIKKCLSNLCVCSLYLAQILTLEGLMQVRIRAKQSGIQYKIIVL